MLKIKLSAIKDLTISDLKKILISFAFAKKENKKVIFIINDSEILDENQKIPQESIDILKKFAVEADETIYQSQNSKIYQNIALQLLKEQKAYACFCNNNQSDCECKNLHNKEIEKFKKGKIEPKIKLKTQNEKDDFTILNPNLTATEPFANAIDNMLYNINTIFIYEEEKDLEKLNYIYTLLNYDINIEYVYLKELKNSKIKIKELLESGFIPDAIINYILTLSCNLKKEFFYLPDFIKIFNLDCISSKNNNFNIEDLKEFNKKHLKEMDSKKLSSIVGFADSDIGDLLKLYLDKFYSINELEIVFKNIFSKKECNSDLKKISLLIKEAPYIEDFDSFIEYLSQKSSFNKEKIKKLLRVLITNLEKDEVDLEKIYKYINPYLTEVAQCQ